MRTICFLILFKIVALFGGAGVVFASDLPACPSSGYLHNCFGTYTFDPNSKWAGDKYVGEFRDNTFHGQGTYTFADGERYVGEFKDDLKSGKGTLVQKAGTYSGQWLNDKREGKGYQSLKDGTVYEGDFSNGVAHGLGKLTRTGMTYEGGFKLG